MTPGSGSVLCADDDPQVRSLLQAFFRKEGYEAETVADGEAVLERLKSTTPDVMLLDVRMPKIDGITLCRSLKSRHATQHIPIIFISGMTETEDVVVGLRAGADDYVCKPFRLQELKARVDNVLDRKRQLDRLHADNHEMFEALGEQSQSITELFTFGQRMNQAQNLGELLQVLATSFSRLTRRRQAMVFLKESKSGAFLLEEAHGPAIPRSLIGQVALSGETVDAFFRQTGTLLVTSAQQLGLKERLKQWLPEPIAESLITVPLIVGNRRIGLVCLVDPDGDRPSGRELASLMYLAQSAGISVANRLRELQIRETQDVTIFAMAKLAENRDELTGNHLLRVQTYCRELILRLREHGRLGGVLTPEFIEEVCRAAPLHDIGKVGIPDEILLKPGKLTPEEFAVMTQHTLIGGRTLQEAGQLLKHDSFLNIAQEICFSHHERWDGNGYPWRLRGEAIPIAARIVACADVYDALTTARPHKGPFPHEKAVEIIRQGHGTHFDPDICDAFLSLEEKFNAIRERLQDATPSGSLLTSCYHAQKAPGLMQSGFSPSPPPT